METLLLHKDLLYTKVFDDICSMLKSSGVKIFSGPNLAKV
jgi:hypothetical protein